MYPLQSFGKVDTQQDRQHCNKTDFSTAIQLLMFINTLVEAHESSTPIDTIYLDIRKAFDSVPHKELLTKLWSLGIHGSLWQWFNAYLTNRK